MKVRIIAAGVVIATFLTSCSVRDNEDKSSKITNNSKKVEVIQENNQLETKVKDMRDIIELSLEAAYKSDEKLKVLEPDVTIDNSGKIISLMFNVDGFIDNFGVDRQIGKNYFASQTNEKDWEWMKKQVFDYYGKEAKINSYNEVTIKIINKNDGVVIKTM